MPYLPKDASQRRLSSHTGLKWAISSSAADRVAVG
jgi:hypothetical protein